MDDDETVRQVHVTWLVIAMAVVEVLLTHNAEMITKFQDEIQEVLAL
jgi:hypothetical protein